MMLIRDAKKIDMENAIVIRNLCTSYFMSISRQLDYSSLSEVPQLMRTSSIEQRCVLSNVRYAWLGVVVVVVG